MNTMTARKLDSITDQFHLLVNNGFGVYAMQALCERYDIDGVEQGRINAVLNNDPNTFSSEVYWESVEYILEYGSIWIGGRKYYLSMNDGDIWAIPSWIQYPESFWDVWQI